VAREFGLACKTVGKMVAYPAPPGYLQGPPGSKRNRSGIHWSDNSRLQQVSPSITSPFKSRASDFIDGYSNLVKDKQFRLICLCRSVRRLLIVCADRYKNRLHLDERFALLATVDHSGLACRFPIRVNRSAKVRTLEGRPLDRQPTMTWRILSMFT
jgi:hypothetical protein